MHGNAVSGPDADQWSTDDGDQAICCRFAAADVSRIVELPAMDLA